MPDRTDPTRPFPTVTRPALPQVPPRFTPSPVSRDRGEGTRRAGLRPATWRAGVVALCALMALSPGPAAAADVAPPVAPVSPVATAASAPSPTPPPAPAGRRLALLVGIGEYAERMIPPLEGPAHDIAAVRQVLQRHWRFRAEDIAVLQDRQATRAAILAALADLERRSAPGDQLFIYLSGHGTSAQDKDNRLPLPHTSGAFLPHDLKVDTAEKMVEQLIVGQRDLRPLLERLDRGGRRVLVISDSCYSGQAVRSVVPRADGARPALRHVPLARLLGEPEAPRARTRSVRPAPPPYPYGNVYFIAAASDSEAAQDIRRADLPALPTWDMQPHGALTDALLRVMSGQVRGDRNGDGRLDQGELFNAVRSTMAPRGYSHTPQVLPAPDEDLRGLSRQPVFEAPPDTVAVSAPPPLAAAPALAAAGSTVAAATAIAAAAPAVSVSVTPASPPAAADVLLRLRADDDGAQALLAGWPARPGLERVAAGRQADLALRTGPAGWRLLGPAGDLVGEGPMARAAALQQRVEHELWLRGLVARVQAGARHGLELSALPGSRGGTFVEGERLNLALRSGAAGAVLVLHLDSQGTINVLYPYTRAETAGHAADVSVVTPPRDNPIVVTPPFGTDELVALSFRGLPAFWPMLPVRGPQRPDGPLLQALEAAVRERPADVAAATLTLRTLPRLGD